MNKVLYIKANPKKLSRTFKISDAFINEYKSLNPNDEIVTLDLYKENLAYLQEEDLALNLSEKDYSSHPIFKYAYQFKNADKYVIAAPMWNLSFPAILKTYIDSIFAANITFKYTETGPISLCKGTKAIHIVSRGGFYTENSELEMGDKYLEKIFKFLGIKDYTTVVAEGLDFDPSKSNEIVQRAIEEATKKAKTF